MLKRIEKVVALLAVVAVVGVAVVLLVPSGSSTERRPAHAAAAWPTRSACSVHAARPDVPSEPRSETIAFVRYDRGSYAIFSMSSRGGRARRLSPAPPRNLPARQKQYQDAPAWSPDGREIAFASDRDGGLGIYVMRADGSHTRRLSPRSVEDSSPTWSPDARWIAFTRGKNDRLYVMRADGRNVRPLTSSPGARDTDPAWSPDGTRIAFVRHETGIGAALYLVRPDGRGPCRLTPFTAAVYGPAWSPGGSELAYSAGTGHGFGIHVVRADGRGRRELTSQGLDFNPQWSPDGTRIAFSRSATLFVMDANGTHVHRLTRGTIDDTPAWRPVA